MSKIIRGLILILALMPSFLDVISPSESCKRSCRDYKKDPITVEIYYYDGEKYQHEMSYTDVYKNTLLNLSEYDYPTLENHVFLGWYRVSPHYQETIRINTLSELEEYPGQIVEKLPTRVSNDCMYFPLLINEDELVNFLETSTLCEVEVEIRLRYPNETKNVIAKARLYETYEDVINFYLDEDYEYVGSSITNYQYDSFVKNIGTENVEVFDITKKLEYNSYFTINVYFVEK